MGSDILLRLFSWSHVQRLSRNGKKHHQVPALTFYGFPSPPGPLKSHPLAHKAPAESQSAATTHWHPNGCQNQAVRGNPLPGLRDPLRRLNPGKPRPWLAFRKFRAVSSSCGSSSTTNSLTEWQQLYWQANSIKAPASNKVSGSPLCIKNMESCLHFPECPQPSLSLYTRGRGMNELDSDDGN